MLFLSLLFPALLFATEVAHAPESVRSKVAILAKDAQKMAAIMHALSRIDCRTKLDKELFKVFMATIFDHCDYMKRLSSHITVTLEDFDVKCHQFEERELEKAAPILKSQENVITVQVDHFACHAKVYILSDAVFATLWNPKWTSLIRFSDQAMPASIQFKASEESLEACADYLKMNPKLVEMITRLQRHLGINPVEIWDLFNGKHKDRFNDAAALPPGLCFAEKEGYFSYILAPTVSFFGLSMCGRIAFYLQSFANGPVKVFYMVDENTPYLVEI